MSRDKKQDKLNKKLKVTFIIFLASAVITAFIILNKGVVFGKRLIDISGANEKSDVHVIQALSATSYLVMPENETETMKTSTEILISIDGEDVDSGYEITSSDENVVAIEGNVVKAVGLGTAVVTVKSTKYDIDESTITFDVVVPITDLELSSEFRFITVGETSQMSYTTRPKDASVSVNVVYTSADTNIATVDSSGIVTGVSSGVTMITGVDKITGLSDTWTITVD